MAGKRGPALARAPRSRPVLAFTEVWRHSALLPLLACSFVKPRSRSPSPLTF